MPQKDAVILTEDLYEIDENGVWEKVADFTEIKKEGVKIETVINLLS